MAAQAGLALTLLALLGAPAPAPAQRLNPAAWSLTLEPQSAAPGAEVLGRLTAKLEKGWHLYSLTTPRPPIATTISLAENAAVQNFRVLVPAPLRRFDPNFGVETETYEGDTVFLLRILLKPDAPAGPLEVTAQARYQLCDDRQCLPPVRRSAAAALTVSASAATVAPSIPAGYAEPRAGSPPPAAPAKPAPGPGALRFLLVAFGFGLAAVFTPCVFPMIPITMSFFLQRPRGGAVAQATVFCLGIVVLFSLLGLATTALLGPFGVVLLGSNPWVNTFIAAVFLVFALSLLGAFEITLPSGLLTRMDRASQRGGYAGTLLMGLTFSLTSFACVGPFVGTLLAASVAGGGWQPLAGMAAFAAGLATPFFFLALFPSYLQKMPRSGGWLARVKVVLGFFILAGMFKYLSNADQVLQWDLLTRERFLAAWVVLFGLAGAYLLGLLRMEGVKPEEPIGVPRLLAGSALLMFAVGLAPGMFGARLGELDAYIPAPREQTATPGAQAGARWMKNQFREALELARRDNKPVLAAFTGYACTNCHWMKANLFPRPEIAAALGDFILVELYTDGTDEASARNQKLQEAKFSTIAIPYYAIFDADEKVLATFPGLTRDPAEYLRFLHSARQAN
ncbi:MAG: thioredoxin family protein [Acidobacteria bacterium]|nr:thioredoxin family protein [Acidobacteriota bacterium]